MNTKRFWKSSKNRYILLIVLVFISAILLAAYYLTKKNSGTDITYNDTIKIQDTVQIIKDPQVRLDNSIDSILYTFGIRPEWITTDRGQQKKAGIKAEWFSKTALIPKDLASAEINLDISLYLTERGLHSKVTEEIISKDIIMYVADPDSSKQLPGAVIQVIHSDKVNRTSSRISIILDKINEFNDEELDKLILTKNEFSYVFPRNLDDIDIQHKLLQRKRDVIINLILGGKDNYEADFNTEMDEKTIKDRVRSFNADFPSINKVLLTKSSGDAVLNQLQGKITAELIKYNITVLNDSMITQAYKENEKDKLGIFFNTVIQKTAMNKNLIAVYPIGRKDFGDFYKKIMVLKKLGYKFMNLTDYLYSAQEEMKIQREREEKQKQEQQKKKSRETTKKKPDSVKKDTKKKETKKTKKRT